MSQVYEIRVYEKQQLVHTDEFGEPLELGRQARADERLYSLKTEAGRRRMVIARLEEQGISRKHVLLEPIANGRIRLTNLSDTRSIHVDGMNDVRPKAAPCELAPPLLLTTGNKTISVQHPEQAPLNTLAEATRAPGRFVHVTSNFPTLAAPTGMEMEAVVEWLQAAMELLQSAANSSDFFEKAARAAVDLVGLDSGQVLRFENNEWQPAACHIGPHATGPLGHQPSRRVLNKVLSDKRTFWEVHGQTAVEDGSLAGIQAVVAAPILDKQGNVIGALYGDRHRLPSLSSLAPISKVEVMLVELLASGVAAGLARLEQESAALAAHVRLEQFFTPDLARRLVTQPDFLKGRDAEVTVLFCDIRRFSHFSERLGGARTVEWISAVMEALSNCVHELGGVLVDYVGDELMAMWGAPEQRADHARMACQAALAMLDQLPKLNESWQPILQEPMGIGIGINTGMARVGNVGSQRKMKYGPLGNTVNLGSRIQGATKYLKVRLLVTESTYRQLNAGPGSNFEGRRLCTVRVVNIDEPVNLYELKTSAHRNWPTLKQDYEKALEHFEKKELRQAARILGNLQIENPGDGPSLVLLSRVVNTLVQEPAKFDPIWDLPGK
jgi:adenylate cyclase